MKHSRAAELEMVTIAEFMEMAKCSRDSVNRHAGKTMPPLVNLCPGKKGMRIEDVLAWRRGEQPWLKAS